MRKITSLIALCVIALGMGFGLTAASADPSNYQTVKITVLGTNARGADTMANRNSEYVWLRNVTGSTKNVANWSVSDAAGGTNKVEFDQDFTERCDCGLVWVEDSDAATPGAQNKLDLPAGDSIIVYSGAGHDTQPGNSNHAFYRDYRHYLQNTTGETVTLRDADGSTVDKISYDAYGINPTP